MLMAVSCLSPVSTHTLMLALRRVAMLSGTPCRKGREGEVVVCRKGGKGRWWCAGSTVAIYPTTYWS